MTRITTPTRRLRSAMSVVIRNVPKGHNWGWYSNEDPRMHLQSVEKKYAYKVWLENKGKRVFEPADKMPADVRKSLWHEFAKQRKFIEDRWVKLMLSNEWIHLHVALPVVTLVVYPNYPHKFTRVLDLAGKFSPKLLATLEPENIELNREMTSLRLWSDRAEQDEPYDWRLASIVWQD